MILISANLTSSGVASSLRYTSLYPHKYKLRRARALQGQRTRAKATGGDLASGRLRVFERYKTLHALAFRIFCIADGKGGRREAGGYHRLNLNAYSVLQYIHTVL